MKIIKVEKHGLLEDFETWGVVPNYARFFLAKCDEQNGMVALSPFVFNDSVHLTNPHQWFAANAAFWCRAYREAKSSIGRSETLASIRALFFMAGLMGQGSITTLLTRWWVTTVDLHGLPAPNFWADQTATPLH